jgi:Na+-translocating ferredoxin:NAD+ oxidoreductase RnfC subunit
MHIGAPAIATVKAGDMVQRGQPLAAAPDGLGVPVHASITGQVAEVGEHITIRRS